MKWRNAYLLFYERKTPFDINSDEDDEAFKQKGNGIDKVDANISTHVNN